MQNAATSTRNRSVWLSIAAALDKNPLRDLSAHARRVAALNELATEAAASGKRSAAAAAPAAINFGGCVAPETTVPDGNHGDNFAKGVL